LKTDHRPNIGYVFPARHSLLARSRYSATGTPAAQPHIRTRPGPQERAPLPIGRQLAPNRFRINSIGDRNPVHDHEPSGKLPYSSTELFASCAGLIKPSRFDSSFVRGLSIGPTTRAGVEGSQQVVHHVAAGVAPIRCKSGLGFSCHDRDKIKLNEDADIK